MAKKLTSAQTEYAKAWLHDTLILGDVKDKTKSVRSFATSIYNCTSTRVASKAIWEVVIYRKLDNIDAAFNTMAGYSFSTFSSYKDIYKSAEMLASYVAWFCDLNGIYWDNSILTDFEMNEFTSTLLGQALKLYDCFTTSVAKPQGSTSASSSNSSSTGVTRVTPSGNVGELSASAAYDAPLSPWVRDLVSAAGTKEHPASKYMFRIEGVNANASRVVPTVFIRPLTVTGKTGNTNKVFMGSANGRTDCTVYFASLSDANNFLTECNTHGIIPATISTVHVVKRPVDSNGYYKVNTEFGNVYISAKKLKEALTNTPKEETKESTTEESTLKEEREFDSFAFTDNLMREI